MSIAPQWLSQRDIAKHIGKAFSTMSGYVEQFPQFFPHNGRPGLTRRYYPQALAVAETISSLKSQRMSVRDITQVLQDRFPLQSLDEDRPVDRDDHYVVDFRKPVDAISGSPAGGVEVHQTEPAQYSPDDCTLNVQSAAERSTPNLPTLTSADAASHQPAKLQHLQARVAELEATVRRLELRLGSVDTERDEFHQMLAADLLERDRLMVNWVKQLCGGPDRTSNVSTGFWQRLFRHRRS